MTAICEIPAPPGRQFARRIPRLCTVLTMVGLILDDRVREHRQSDAWARAAALTAREMAVRLSLERGRFRGVGSCYRECSGVARRSIRGLFATGECDR